MELPYELIRCSWPRPIEQRNGVWVSEPDWQAPKMPFCPQPQWTRIDGDLYWLLDWREFFRGGIRDGAPNSGGEMRQFHVVFEITVRRAGTLVFWDDDGSIIRRNQTIIHSDRTAHMLERHQIAVEEGDQLTIAQWQLCGGWLWGAKLLPAEALTRVFPGDYLPMVMTRLKRPSGPPLKYFVSGRTPLRAAVAVYSLILNGYVPSSIILFGDHQWDAEARTFFADALPFAELVTIDTMNERIYGAGGRVLVEWARQYWWVMKTCVALLSPPFEFALMDDDIFILDSLEDALAAFATHDLVYAPDADHGRTYAAVWARTMLNEAFPTGRFNAGLYWMRTTFKPRDVAHRMRAVPPARINAFVWEQGFIATQFARSCTLELPTWKYLFPLFDGLPGGPLGYDYRSNPCGFASIHFGGLRDKPDDETVRLLLGDVLARRRR